MKKREQDKCRSTHLPYIHQGQILEKFGYLDQESSHVISGNKNPNKELGLATCTAHPITIRWEVKYFVPPKEAVILVLENHMEFFLQFAFIITGDRQIFRLIVIHDGRVRTDILFPSLASALAHFASQYRRKAWKDKVIPIWKMLCDDKLKRAFLEIRAACNQPLDVRSNNDRTGRLPQTLSSNPGGWIHQAVSSR